jgi:hypothetical protein
MKFSILHIIISGLIIFTLCVQLHSQVIIQEPPGLSAAFHSYSNLNLSKNEINGWSILITLNRDRRQMEKMELRFKYHFSELQDFVSWRFEDPYYKLIVGAFPNRISSLPLLEAIRQKFPAAFEIKFSFPPEEIIEFRKASYNYIMKNNLND